MSRNRFRMRLHENSLRDMTTAHVYEVDRELGNFFLAKANYPPDLQVPTHAHENPSLYLVLSGRIGEKRGNKAVELKAGTVGFTPQDEPHSNYTKGIGSQCFIIDSKRQWLDSFREASLELNQNALFDGGLPVALARRAYHEFCCPDSLSPMVIEGLMLELLAEVSRQKTKPEGKCPRWLEQVKEKLQADFCEKISLTDLANTVGRHPVHLAAQFRKNYSCTVGDYVRQLRIEFACREIAASEKRLVEIALAAGFSDQGHFSRSFKALIGLTPSEYRTIFTRTKQRQKPSNFSSNPRDSSIVCKSSKSGRGTS